MANMWYAITIPGNFLQINVKFNLESQGVHAYVVYTV